MTPKIDSDIGELYEISAVIKATPEIRKTMHRGDEVMFSYNTYGDYEEHRLIVKSRYTKNNEMKLRLGVMQ